MGIYEIIEQVRATSSKNEKIAILEQYKDTPFLKDYLFYTYAPNVNFYMKKLPKVDNTALSSIKTLEEAARECVRKLASRSVTGNAAKTFVEELFVRVSQKDMELLQMMLLKDVKAGINISTINKVYEHCIFVPPYQRCSLEADAKPEAWDWRTSAHYLQLKADGMFCNVIRLAGKVTLMSRQGNVFPQGILKELEEDLIHLPNESVYMGELTIWEDGVLLDRQTGNGMLNSCLQGSEIDPKYEVHFDAWDCVSYGQWREGYSDAPYNERFDHLVWCIDYKLNSDLVHVIESREVNSLIEAKEICNEWMKIGLEGGILKNAWSVWKDSQSKHMIKLKMEVTVELYAEELVEGKGKNANTFGSITCRSSDGLLEVDVSGFTDAMRKDIFDNWDDFYKGKVFSVTANALLKPGPNNSKHSLFLPRFAEVRMDKTEADSLEKIVKEFAEFGGNNGTVD